MRDNEETVEFRDVVCKRETDKALLCEIDGHDHWIAKSQVAPESEVNEEDDVGTLVITAWLAKQKGLA